MLRRAGAPSSRRQAACASREKRPVSKYEVAPPVYARLQTNLKSMTVRGPAPADTA
jgi:hypothetical protein